MSSRNAETDLVFAGHRCTVAGFGAGPKPLGIGRCVRHAGTVGVDFMSRVRLLALGAVHLSSACACLDGTEILSA